VVRSRNANVIYRPFSGAPCEGTVFQRVQNPPGNYRSSR